MTKLKPYYETELGKLYHGDCLEIMPQLEPVDLVLTDPPYGIADVWKGGFGKKHGWNKADSVKAFRNSWDTKPPTQEVFDAIFAVSKKQIIWGGNYFKLPPSRCWLVWNKPERGFTLAEAELAWTNADNIVRVCDCKRSDTGRIHPTQKPTKLMFWCLGLSWSKNATTILDPYLGSGTTAIACECLKRKWIGIEIEEKYCEIAAKRIELERKQLKLF